MSFNACPMLVNISAVKKWRNWTFPNGEIKISQKVHLISTKSVLKKSYLNGFRHIKVIKHTTASVNPAMAPLNMKSSFTMKACPARQKVQTANINEAVYIVCETSKISTKVLQ